MADLTYKRDTTLEDLLKSIATVESGGSYSAIGKPNKKGQKAYGKYQVMDFNIPSWTKEILGYAMTPAQFLKDVGAQEKVAMAKIGDALKKYGNPADAASVWFSGRPVSKAGNDSDVTGTTVPQYVKKVLSYMPQQVTQVASAATGGPDMLNNLNAALKNLQNRLTAIQRGREVHAYNPPRIDFGALNMNKSPSSFTSLGKVTSPYGGKTTQEGFHPGVDIANYKGTPIPSTTSGTVTNAINGRKQGENNFGNQVAVRDGNGDTHTYSHLDKGYVRAGDRIKKGQLLGTMGNSGATYSASGQGDGTNLDYRIITAYGKYKNPMTYLKNI